MKFQSEFAYLDVKRGRVGLRKRLARDGGRVPVTIRGFIACEYGKDDGESQEFEVEVSKVTVDT